MYVVTAEFVSNGNELKSDLTKDDSSFIPMHLIDEKIWNAIHAYDDKLKNSNPKRKTGYSKNNK